MDGWIKKDRGSIARGAGYTTNNRNTQNINLNLEVPGMKKKRCIVIAIILVLMVLLTPIRINLKDGGSVRYKALVYEVTKIHQLTMEEHDVKPYIDGLEVKILGITVYRKTNK